MPTVVVHLPSMQTVRSMRQTLLTQLRLTDSVWFSRRNVTPDRPMSTEGLSGVVGVRIVGGAVAVGPMRGPEEKPGKSTDGCCSCGRGGGRIASAMMRVFRS